jgi:hypothetical protein
LSVSQDISDLLQMQPNALPTGIVPVSQRGLVEEAHGLSLQRFRHIRVHLRCQSLSSYHQHMAGNTSAPNSSLPFLDRPPGTSALINGLDHHFSLDVLLPVEQFIQPAEKS